MRRCCAPENRIWSLKDARASLAAIPPVSTSCYSKWISASTCNTIQNNKKSKKHNTHTDSYTLHLILLPWVLKSVLKQCVLYKLFTFSCVVTAASIHYLLFSHPEAERSHCASGMKHAESWCTNDCGMYAFFFSSSGRCCVQLWRLMRDTEHVLDHIAIQAVFTSAGVK